MTALGINATDRDTPATWGAGNVSGHARPALVEQAYANELEAWANYNRLVDEFYEGYASHQQVSEAREIAFRAGIERDTAYTIWQSSMGDCTCHPIDADRDYTCHVCRAKAILADAEDEAMPF